MTGTIARLQLEKGFGFIKDNAGQDYFFHRSAVVGEGMENLREGDSVEFTVARDRKVHARKASAAHQPKTPQFSHHTPATHQPGRRPLRCRHDDGAAGLSAGAPVALRQAREHV